MAAIITKDMRLHNAKQFVEAVTEQANTSIYVFLGRPMAWPNESAPPLHPDTYTAQIDTWNNMEVLKVVGDNDVSHCIPRYDWKLGNVYYQYNDRTSSANLFDSQFVVMNSEYNVYKCVSNGGGNITINEPSGTGSTSNNFIFNTSIGQDGYIWKYMYNIPLAKWLKFGTPSFIPVIDSAFTSDAANVAANSRGLYAYNIVSANVGTPPSGSPPGDGVHTITIVGDGTGATACVKITSGNISNVIVNSYGSNYTLANVTTFLGNAVVEPIVAPPEGHGLHPIDEVGGVYTMVNVRFEQTDAPIVPSTNFKFRQVGVIKDPFLFGTQRIPTKTTSNILLAAYANLTVSGAITNSDQLIAGAILRGGTSGANATVVSYSGNVINFVKSRDTSANIEGNFKAYTLSETLYVGTYAIGTLFSTANATVQPKSGEIMYVDNRNVITRATDQVEDIYVVLEF
jgi:hypothetical protein